MKMRRVLAWVFLVMLLTVSAASAEAWQSSTPLPGNIQFALGAVNVEIRPMKERLKELGYYDGVINYEMDNDAIYALKRFCEDNQIEYSAYGVTKSAFYALTSGQVFASVATPPPANAVVYETLPFGTVSDAVLNIQIRLKELGYYEGQQLTPNTYDWGFQAAIDLFCLENNITKTDMEVTPSLQKIIFSNIDFTRQGMRDAGASPAAVRPAGYRYTLGESSPEIWRLQEKLNMLGYYHQAQYSYELNTDTLYAFNLYCYDRGLGYSESGISEENWTRIMAEDMPAPAAPAPAEAPAKSDAYIHIQEEDSGEAVSSLQLRLIELGYADDAEFELGTYDLQLQEAIMLFCDYNHFVYSGPGISADIQRAVFSPNAARYSPDDGNMGLIQRMRSFLLSSHTVFGIQAAGYALTLAGVAVFTVFLVLLVLLIPGKPASGMADEASASLQGFSKPRTEVPAYAGNPTRLVDFSIRYQGSERRERFRFSDQLKIGRSPECDLVLSPDDRGISRCHCTLQIRAGSMVLSDVSVNGTFINDKRHHKTECTVRSGDRIQIGRHLLIIKF